MLQKLLYVYQERQRSVTFRIVPWLIMVHTPAEEVTNAIGPVSDMTFTIALHKEVLLIWLQLVMKIN